jgi:hypothetical protein
LLLLRLALLRLALLYLALLYLALLYLALLYLALLRLALLKLNCSNYSRSLLILFALNVEDNVLVDIEDTELRLRIGVYAYNYIPYSAVKVSNCYERRTSTDLFAKFVNLVY